MAGENKGMLICFMCFFSSLGFIGFCMCATLALATQHPNPSSVVEAITPAAIPPARRASLF
jgi:hypothetical protein